MKRKSRNILTKAQRLEIQRLYITTSITQKDLAETYNVRRQTIENIVKGLRRYEEWPYREWYYDENDKLIPIVKSPEDKYDYYLDNRKIYREYERDDFWLEEKINGKVISLDWLKEKGVESTEDNYSEESFP